MQPVTPADGADGGASDRARQLNQLRQRFSSLQLDEAMPLAEALHQAGRDAGDWATAAEAALLLAKGHANRGQPAPAQDWAARAALAAQRAQAPALGASAWVLLASERARLQQAGPAMQAASRVLQLMAGVEDPRAVATVFTGLAFAYEALGLGPHALDAARRALQAGYGLPEAAIRLRLHINVVTCGLTAWEQLQPVDPVAAARLLDDLAAQMPDIDRLTSALQQQGVPARSSHDFLAAGLAVRRGDPSAAAAPLRTLTARPDTLPPPLQAEAWLLLAAVEQAQADGQAAARAAEAAIALADRHGDDSAAWLARRARAEELRGRHGAALALQRRGHARQLASVQAALDARIDEMAARLVEFRLRDENRQLRAHNQGLEASVQQISRLVATDPLTGLANRRALEAAYDGLQASRQPLVLAMLDLDHFKAINDGHSHAVGDAVLREAADQMAGVLRSPDLLARYGGEEFVAVLAGLVPEEALAVLERVRLAVRGHNWQSVAPGLRVTVSVGLTAVADGESLAEAMDRADALLYRAKAGGRDRVVADGSPGDLQRAAPADLGAPVPHRESAVQDPSAAG